MPVNKKQLVRLVRLVAQLKETAIPPASFAADMRKADIEENLNLPARPRQSRVTSRC